MTQKPSAGEGKSAPNLDKDIIPPSEPKEFSGATFEQKHDHGGEANEMVAPQSAIEDVVREFDKGMGTGFLFSTKLNYNNMVVQAANVPEIHDWLRTTLRSFEATIRADEAEKCNEHIEKAREEGYRKGLVENCIAMNKQLLDDLKAAKVGEPLDDLIKDIKEKAIAEERASKKTLIECPHVESQGICQKCIEFLRAQERTRIIGLVEKMKKEGCGCTRKSQLNSGCPGWTQEDAALVNDALSRIIEILKGR